MRWLEFKSTFLTMKKYVLHIYADCLPSEYQCNDGFCLDGNAISDRKPDCIDQVINKYYYRDEKQRISPGYILFPSHEMSIEATDYLEVPLTADPFGK